MPSNGRSNRKVEKGGAAWTANRSAYHIAQRIKNAFGTINFLEWERGVLIWKAAVAKKEECHK